MAAAPAMAATDVNSSCAHLPIVPCVRDARSVFTGLRAVIRHRWPGLSVGAVGPFRAGWARTELKIDSAQT